MKHSLLSALAPFLAAAPALAGTITVDDDQPADFATIQAAIDAASPGDVILVHAGSFPPFVLSKELSILGPAGGARPEVTGRSVVVGAPAFQIAGLQLGGLSVTGVAGRGAVDDCLITGDGTYQLDIKGCGQIEVTRTVVAGTEGKFASLDAATLVVDSVVAFVDSSLRGGAGVSEPVLAWAGQLGLWASHSYVTLSGCDIAGGDGGVGTLPHIGAGGTCVRADRSKVVLRGDGDPLSPGQSFGINDGYHFFLVNSYVVYSGVELAGTPAIANHFSRVLELPSPEPFLTLGGSDLPGEARRLLLYGPLGEAALVAVSLAPAYFTAPTLEGALWISPDAVVQVIALTTAGPSAPKTLLWAVPPSLVGLEGRALQVQAVFPGLPGALEPTKSAVTNPANAILRF